MSRSWIGWVLMGLVTVVQGGAQDPARPDPDAPRPIAARDTVFLDEMTWMEARDALRAGKTTAIVATGGLEQSGPYLSSGKHNIVLRATADSIARQLGNAVVATIVPYVPEGGIDPPTEHMRYPSTISITEETYQRLLTDICAGLRSHGFENIVLIGDSGGNQAGLKAVAEALNQKWGGDRARVHYIAEYYDYPGIERWLAEQGVQQKPEGLHDDFAITSIMMTVDPNSVRFDERVKAGKATINGVDLTPKQNAIDWGRRIVQHRTEITCAAIRRSLAGVH